MTEQTEGAEVVRPLTDEPRATHCIRGHEFTAENTRHHKGVRHCRACIRERAQAAKERQAS